MTKRTATSAGVDTTSLQNDMRFKRGTQSPDATHSRKHSRLFDFSGKLRNQVYYEFFGDICNTLKVDDFIDPTELKPCLAILHASSQLRTETKKILSEKYINRHKYIISEGDEEDEEDVPAGESTALVRMGTFVQWVGPLNASITCRVELDEINQNGYGLDSAMKAIFDLLHSNFKGFRGSVLDKRGEDPADNYGIKSDFKYSRKSAGFDVEYFYYAGPDWESFTLTGPLASFRWEELDWAPWRLLRDKQGASKCERERTV